MKISPMGVCRGDGKVYIRVSIREYDINVPVLIESHTAGGKAIPCDIYRSLDNSDQISGDIFVAVFPILKLNKITYTIFQDAMPTNKVSCTLDFFWAKWLSRLNYRMRPSLCEDIRGFDKISTYVNANFEFWECIADGSECILRGLITLPYCDNSDISIHCTDAQLKQISINPVFISNTKVESKVSSDVFLREIQVSIRVPSDDRNLIFILQDNNNPHFNSFNVLPRRTKAHLLAETGRTMLNAQIDPQYPAWFAAHKASIDVLSKQVETFFENRPRFSIIVPIYKTPKKFFLEMLGSVQEQSYGKWELVLVNASPDDAALSDLVQQASDSDKRIKALTLKGNLGIAENTNAGISVATGDFIAFFDHDDLIEPDLLFEYAKAINEHPHTDLLYCDEDKLMPDGELAQPFFKPDFNIDLLRNNNYICHMLTIRRTLLNQLELSTSEYDGAQDHNLTLLASEKARHVHHVPRVLYHWRISETSTASSADNKPYATKAGIKAVQAHLNRVGINATVCESRRPFTYKITYRVPEKHPLVSIIIPTKDLIDVLDNCLNSILEKTTYPNYEIILVENNSTESKTFEYYAALESNHSDKITIVTWPHEFNFSKIINFGARAAKGEYLLLLNNDTELITPNWIERMIGICARQDVGAVGVRLYYRDDTIQHAGVCVTGGVAGHLGKNLPRGQWGYFALADAEQDLSAVTAACLMTKRSVFESVNGFTEELAVAFNDIDYCLKVRESGKLIVYTPEVELYHYESISRGFETSVEKRIRFHRETSYMNYRWAEYYVKGDPYININITANEPFNCYYHL